MELQKNGNHNRMFLPPCSCQPRDWIWPLFPLLPPVKMAQARVPSACRAIMSGIMSGIAPRRSDDGSSERRRMVKFRCLGPFGFAFFVFFCGFPAGISALQPVPQFANYKTCQWIPARTVNSSESSANRPRDPFRPPVIWRRCKLLSNAHRITSSAFRSPKAIGWEN